MFVKIFHGDSQKFKLIQSDDVEVCGERRMLSSDLYPVLCAYIDCRRCSVGEEASVPEYLGLLTDLWSAGHVSDDFKSMDETISELAPDRSFRDIVPILSERQQKDKCELLLGHSLQAVCNERVHVVTVGDKTYITTGPIFVMNDDGKTIEKNA